MWPSTTARGSAKRQFSMPLTKTQQIHGHIGCQPRIGFETHYRECRWGWIPLYIHLDLGGICKPWRRILQALFCGKSGWFKGCGTWLLNAVLSVYAGALRGRQPPARIPATALQFTALKFWGSQWDSLVTVTFSLWPHWDTEALGIRCKGTAEDPTWHWVRKGRVAALTAATPVSCERSSGAWHISC